jgi:hypothetical protein
LSYNVKQNKIHKYEVVTATDFTLSFDADHHHVQNLAMLANKRKATKPETIKCVEVWCVGEVLFTSFSSAGANSNAWTESRVLRAVASSVFTLALLPRHCGRINLEQPTNLMLSYRSDVVVAMTWSSVLFLCYLSATARLTNPEVLEIPIPVPFR